VSAHGTDESTRTGDLVRTALVALGLRLVVVAVAWNRFSPADDGVFYDVLARRLATGAGYTWLWPDGVVTPVAHYPVGYPAMLAVAYRALGEHPSAALLMHALVGAVGAVAVHAVASYGFSRRAACFAGMAVAFHPALLSYTPAVMTEGVCSALVAAPFACALFARECGARRAGLRLVASVIAGVLLGGACLVRPQVLLLAPFVAALSTGTPLEARRLIAPAFVLVAAACVLVPWTLRNYGAFGRPVLVSANSGWNLLIGTDADGNGGWRALEAPAECREVWGEADKDACFGRVARRRILKSPGAWLSLVPSKLAVTFDLGGSGPSYRSRARPDLVPRTFVLALGGFETLVERATVLVTLLVLAFEAGGRRRTRVAIGAVSILFLLVRHAWPAYAGLAALLVLGERAKSSAQPLRVVTGSVLAATLVTHAVFFGAGRYALLAYPWVAAMASALLIEAQRSSTRGHVPEPASGLEGAGATVTRSGASNAAMSAKCS